MGINISKAATLKAQIENVNIDEKTQVTVDFYLSNDNGVAVTGLDTLDSLAALGVGIAKLGAQQPMLPNRAAVAEYNSKNQMAEGKQWISYINKEVAPGAGASTKAATQWQAGIESSCKQDCLTNLGSGHYRYTFSKTLADYPQFTGLDTQYDANAPTRIYLELLADKYGDVSKTLVNTTYDFIPATGKMVATDEGRQLVDPQQSCYRCHTADLGNEEHRLLMHGDKRFNFDGCVMCHTTYSGDPETGNAIDMATLVHKIHQADYKIVGYGSHLHDYSNVQYPGEVADCQSCHISDATAQASQYTIPGNNSCLSCHKDKISQAPDTWDGTAAALFHDRELFPKAWNNGCAGCHPDSSNPQGANLFHDKLVQTRQTLKDLYGMSLSDVTLGNDSLKVSVEFDKLVNFPAQEPAISKLLLVVNGQPDLLNRPLNNGQHQMWDISKAGDNVSLSMDGHKLTATISNVDVAALGDVSKAVVKAKMLVCANQDAVLAVGCNSEDASSEVEVISANALDLTGAVSKRPVIASEQGCQSCHDGEMQQRIMSAHTTPNVTVSGQSCDSCHNPVSATALTDGSCNSCHNNDTVAYLNADNTYHVAGADHIKAIRTINNSLNYRDMVHALHAGTRTVSAMGAPNGAVTYPQSASNCQACHSEGQLKFTQLKQENSQLVAAEDAEQDTVGQISELSPTVAACAACHNDVAHWAGHAIKYGGVYAPDASGGRTYQVGGETCAYCHAEGQSYDVIKLHQNAGK
ncbi:OmcA/MtrC family decaheme c-type cytochrome [Shewanella sp. YIC-542]|uniref:OmcA/MtrC family decaheme c-type cytochrome n=1 Tax=Shewanella mytili TaxID=3377111 RepID=UPI00398EAE69